MKPGKINKLNVLRKTDLGYMLTNGKEEVFLHNNETNHQTLEPGDPVDAFLYYDFKNRLSATLYKPLIEEGKRAFLKVVGVNFNIGVFVDMGINKDLLVSYDELSNNKRFWPEVGDVLYLTLVVKNRLVGKLIKPSEVIAAPTSDVNEKDELSGYIIETTKHGLNVLTENLNLIFIHHTQKRKRYRLGEKLDVIISRVYEEVLNGTLILQKEKMIDIDSEAVLEYLMEHKKMKLTSDSTPDEIRELFPMSKRAFKRAIGSLYRRDLIKFEDNYTIYIGEEQ